MILKDRMHEQQVITVKAIAQIVENIWFMQFFLMAWMSSALLGRHIRDTVLH